MKSEERGNAEEKVGKSEVGRPCKPALDRARSRLLILHRVISDLVWLIHHISFYYSSGKYTHTINEMAIILPTSNARNE